MKREDGDRKAMEGRASRRRFLRRAAYAAPALTVLKLEGALAQIGSPPPPPEVVEGPPEG
jgi:hypothetical protein